MQGNYLIPFCHINQSLAAATKSIAPPKARRWLHRQQTQLKTNRLKKVLKTLAEHLGQPQVRQQKLQFAPLNYYFTIRASANSS
jgi:hypothetical protein